MAGSSAIVEVAREVLELRLVFEEPRDDFLDDFCLMELIRVLDH